jgi:hypothetical protein
MGLPIRGDEREGWIEDGDATFLVAIAAFAAAAVAAERCRVGGDLRNPLEQGRLVVLDLDDQADVGLRSDLEMFF